ncbi:hypothetical protein SISNIDRAFT_469665 [Sistotremastrum niveocremeum HHB9708]|uniref:DUF6535 domain-containing protein n=1 Tax=Sistotremastrum niveocremeum HHB9708 TaxID=1314777 RepID=A0A164PR32_9AGAM|nr:hypothetical protein SISNIDRAFT_469665 [Sistotremastrum niveocremeum HHB9708]
MWCGILEAGASVGDTWMPPRTLRVLILNIQDGYEKSELSSSNFFVLRRDDWQNLVMIDVVDVGEEALFALVDAQSSTARITSNTSIARSPRKLRQGEKIRHEAMVVQWYHSGITKGPSKCSTDALVIMSLPTERSNLERLDTESHPTTSSAFSTNLPLPALRDIQNTPAFNILIDLVKEQNTTTKEHCATANEQLKVLEDLRGVMKDVKKSLRKQSKFLKGSTRRQLKANVRKAVNEVARGIRGSDRTSSPALSTTSDAPSTTSAHPRSLTVHQSGEAAADMPGALSGINRQSDTVPSESQNVSDVVLGEPDQMRAAAPPNPINEVIGLLKSVKEVLSQHGSKLDVLIKDAIKDDQPYDHKPLDDESTCTALFEIAVARTKEEVDEWIKRMDVSLVFIALFSAVLTAFVVPATQNLFPSSNNTPGIPTDSPPPVPNTSAQNVCILYYLALILAILDAVLSVLGRQWMSKLTTRPVGSTYRERLLRHIAREELAKRWLGVLVDGLHILLLWSIGLFMTGLLYQILNLSGSFERSTPRIFAAWIVGVVLSSGILLVVLAATTHALVYEVSPFGGPFSKLLYKAAEGGTGLFVALTGQIFGLMRDLYHSELTWSFWRDESKRPETLRELRQAFQSIPFQAETLLLAVQVLTSPMWLCWMLVKRWRVELYQDDRGKLIGVFMDLMAEASDPKLLEKAVGSFSYVEWFENGEGKADQLEKVENRLLATDTSVRVRETLRARAKQFVPPDSQQLRDMGERLTRDHVRSFLAVHSYPARFGNSLSEVAFEPDNSDLRPLSALPFEECVARVLCSYNHKGKLGDRGKILDLAEKHCRNLLWVGKVDDVTRILSHVDRLDLTTSYIQHPNHVSTSVVEFIVKDHEHEILREINEFVQTVDDSRLDPQSLSQVFVVLASPPPTDIDLSPLINYISRHPHFLTWEKTSDAIIAYLNSFSVSQVSKSAAVRRFLRLCIDPGSRDTSSFNLWEETNDEAKIRICREAQTLLDILDGRIPTSPIDNHEPLQDANAYSSLPASPSQPSSPHSAPHSPQSSIIGIPIDISALPDARNHEKITTSDPSNNLKPPAIPMHYFSLALPPPVASVTSTSDPIFDIAPTLEKGRAHIEA